jgi:glycosyltransferase involved in cell wall biosynthesis
LPRVLADHRGEYLLHVGAMVPRKDLPTLFAAFAEISEEFPRMLLVLAGNKTLRWASSWPQLERMMDERPSLRRRVVVLNYVNDRDLPSLYQGAAAAVSSTLWEGFGLTVLEALASGVPVVSSRVSSIPEIAGEAVYYGEVRDAPSYADAIRHALTDHNIACATRGREIARQFSWERTARETLAVYREAAL